MFMQLKVNLSINRLWSICFRMLETLKEILVFALIKLTATWHRHVFTSRYWTDSCRQHPDLRCWRDMEVFSQLYMFFCFFFFNDRPTCLKDFSFLFFTNLLKCQFFFNSICFVLLVEPKNERKYRRRRASQVTVMYWPAACSGNGKNIHFSHLLIKKNPLKTFSCLFHSH